MNIDLNDEALEYGQVASRALEAAGGDELVQRAEAAPHERGAAVARVLGELGALDLDPRGSADELEAAAALCRAAGWWAVPDPVAERLARPRDIDADGLVVVDERRPAGRIAGLDGRWVAVTLDGRRSIATARPSDLPTRKTAFVADLALEPVDEAGAADVALGLVLPCWTLLGMLDRAVALAAAYVQEREQFGQPLARFQGVQFQLTDAEVERAGVEALAKYALWSVQDARPEAVDDALALRVAALDAAEVVFRVSHQLHGAIGFCDETTVSWVSRHSQPLRRLPFATSATLDALARRIGRRGLTGIFSEAPTP
ncbi:MAG TPA: acyl-CoA dehydrogenase family protein [Acidimicrobiales bacterium]|nr:acyl-CoA dehydrogenase family protein [Acidimicrobiales bacterium]